MSKRFYTKSRSEIDMRFEFNAMMNGLYPEIPKAQNFVLRKMRRTGNPQFGPLEKCPCVDSITKEPDVDTWCSICLTGDTLIKTPTSLKEIKNILVGDEVIGSDGNAYKIIDKQTFYTKELIKIKSQLRADELKMTPDHIMMVIKVEDYKKRHFVISEVKAQDLKEKDLLIMPKPKTYNTLQSIKVDWSKYETNKDINSSNKLPGSINLTDTFLWTLGLWIAEGSIEGNRSLQFTLHIKELDFALKVEKAFKEISEELTVSHIEKPEVNTRIVIVNNAVLARWITDICGSGCQNKHMPYFYQQLSINQQKTIVDGLWEGDGCCMHYDCDRTTNRHSIGITAKKVIFDAQITLWQCGLFAGISSYHRKEKKKVYTLEWINTLNRATRGFFEFPNFWASKITSIEKEKLDVAIPVYDLTINKNHQFIANNTLSHNCQSEGYIWDEKFIEGYKIVLSSDVGQAQKENLFSAGNVNNPIITFFTNSTEIITLKDRLVELYMNADGTIVRPYRRQAIYKIGTALDLRSDNGRLEYVKINCNYEQRKFLNGPGIDND